MKVFCINCKFRGHPNSYACYFSKKLFYAGVCEPSFLDWKWEKNEDGNCDDYKKIWWKLDKS